MKLQDFINLALMILAFWAGVATKSLRSRIEKRQMQKQIEEMEQLVSKLERDRQQQ